MNALEQVALDAYRAVYGADAVEIGGVTCLRAPLAPDSPMMNRVVGLGVEREVDEDQLDVVLAAMDDTTFYVDVTPAADPRLDQLLERRGLEHGWGWMMFERDDRPAPAVASELRVVEVGPARAHAWARIVAAGFDLPESIHGVLGRVPTTPGWSTFLALDGDEPAAAAALWTGGHAAYFTFASTLPEHRGKGAQSALLSTRVERAREAGCRVLVTETGELRDDLPSNSYRNIRRFGFEERFVVAHRVRRRAQPSTA